MKNKYLFLIVLISLIYIGCSKDSVPNTTPLTKTQLLAKYTWQIDEVLRNSAGKNTHYVRGGVNTTGTTYNLVRIIFKEDGKATYTNDLGQTYPATWKFTSADQRNIEFSITNTPVVYIWNFVEISDMNFTNTTAVTSGGNDVLVVSRFVPFP